MWTRNGNKWYLKKLPEVTVEPIRTKSSRTAWQACCAGRPILYILPGTNSRDVMQRAYDYFDRRVDL